MMSHTIHGFHSGMIYSDSSYRCGSCGQGPVMVGNGYLTNRCLNCGWHQHHEPIDLGLKKFFCKTFSWFKSSTKKIINRKNTPLASKLNIAIGGVQ